MWSLTEAVNKAVTRGRLSGPAQKKTVMLILLLSSGRAPPPLIVVNRQAQTFYYSNASVNALFVPFVENGVILINNIYSLIDTYIFKHWLFPVSYHVYCTVKSFTTIV